MNAAALGLIDAFALAIEEAIEARSQEIIAAALTAFRPPAAAPARPRRRRRARRPEKESCNLGADEPAAGRLELAPAAGGLGSLDPTPSVNQIGVCQPEPDLSSRAPAESDLGPVTEPPLPDEAHVVAEVPGAPPAPPDPPAPPAEADPAGRNVEAAGSVAEDVEGPDLAPPAEADVSPEVHAPDSPRGPSIEEEKEEPPRARWPRSCRICGDFTHDSRFHRVKTEQKYSETTPPDAPPAPTYSQTCPEDEPGSSPAVADLRHRMARKSSGAADGRVRSRTIAPSRLTRDERHEMEQLVYPDVDRPITRGDCQGQPRPCPFVSCSAHLYLDVNRENGAIKLNFPHLEVWEMGESCSLDVADRGGVTLEEVGAIINLTRERIRQVEVRGLDKIKRREGDNLEAIAG